VLGGLEEGRAERGIRVASPLASKVAPTGSPTEEEEEEEEEEKDGDEEEDEGAEVMVGASAVAGASSACEGP